MNKVQLSLQFGNETETQTFNNVDAEEIPEVKDRIVELNENLSTGQDQVIGTVIVSEKGNALTLVSSAKIIATTEVVINFSRSGNRKVLFRPSNANEEI